MQQATVNNIQKMIKTRRRFQRVIFNLEDGIIGIFISLLDNSDVEKTAASIMNLSASGIQFAIKKKDASRFQIGNILVFKGIRGGKNLDFFEDIEIEILWKLDLKFLENIGIGCEFKNISKSLRRRINDFVISEIQFRGQNIHRTTL